MDARLRRSARRPVLLAASQLPPRAQSAQAARAMVRAVLSDRLDEDTVHTVELLASEVVTNVIVHARTPCYLRLTERREGAVRLEVYDERGALPPVVSPKSEASAAGGRGLELVEALADRWGARVEPPGKTVWLEVGTGGSVGGDTDDEDRA